MKPLIPVILVQPVILKLKNVAVVAIQIAIAGVVLGIAPASTEKQVVGARRAVSRPKDLGVTLWVLVAYRHR